MTAVAAGRSYTDGDHSLPLRLAVTEVEPAALEVKHLFAEAGPGAKAGESQFTVEQLSNDVAPNRVRRVRRSMRP
jgi:hypothetical protein